MIMTMKERIRDLVLKAAERAHESGVLPSSAFPPMAVEEPKQEAHGDYSTNMAMVMASVQKMAPRKIAEAIINHLEDPGGIIDKTEIAGPGFINFFIGPAAWGPELRAIHEADETFGRSSFGRKERVQVEFVSANPTGPLHVGHGRGAAAGDSVANILEWCGYDVQREYYINDSGRQINTLGRSVFMRYQELMGQSIQFPEDCYQGDYIRNLARDLRDRHGEALLSMDKEAAIDTCARYAADQILDGIRKDLKAFNVRFDHWFSEQSLYDSGKVDRSIQEFRAQKLIYEKDGALWFKTSEFGDEKDRVVVRANGLTTYFASDIAYHKDKFERGFDRVIDVWGADHHGYIPRMTASVEAAGLKRDQFQVILVQLVNLLRGGVPVAMSSRAGEFVTLQEVVEEVGADAARFIFLTRHQDSKLDFDLEVAKQKTNDNPVYYVQYVHARISSILAKAEERGIPMPDPEKGVPNRLETPEEIGLLKMMFRFPEVVETAARLLEPHRITYFLMDLASGFHAYYNKHRILTEDPVLTADRLCLVQAIKIIIRNGLRLLGVSTPDTM
jgi:arginyl-tRNA synthetase